MDLNNWVPAISTASLCGIVIWLSRKLIITRLTNAVNYEYNKKIERLRNELKQSEEVLKAELRSKEAQIEALRNGALTGLINRQSVLYERQIVAVEQIWDAVISYAPSKIISGQIAIINIEVALKEAAKNERAREAFKLMGELSDITKRKPNDAEKARPFVSPMAWALYSAYCSILAYSELMMKLLQIGLDNKELIKTEEIKILLQTVLPHHADYLEKYGESVFHYLLEEIEDKLLIELAEILKGEQADKENVEMAAKIISGASKLTEFVDSGMLKVAQTSEKTP